jgi:type VI protein secretion system component VasF
MTQDDPEYRAELSLVMSRLRAEAGLELAPEGGPRRRSRAEIRIIAGVWAAAAAAMLFLILLYSITSGKWCGR